MKKTFCVLGLFLLVSTIFVSCGKTAKNADVEYMTEAEWQKFMKSINEDDIVYTDDDFMDFVENSDDYLSAPKDFSGDDYVVEIPAGDVYVLTDDHFIAKINDIFENYELYKDKTIVVDGKFIEMVTNDGKAKYPAVYRLCNGCGDEYGWAGFMLIYKGKYPEYDQWIRVSGKPVIKKTKDGYYNLFLKVTSMENISAGNDYVYN